VGWCGDDGAVVPVSIVPETEEVNGSHKVSAMFGQPPCGLEDDTASA
jgi:hypothetical protein